MERFRTLWKVFWSVLFTLGVIQVILKTYAVTILHFSGVELGAGAYGGLVSTILILFALWIIRPFKKKTES